jgi:iron(III) transport system substrate-binding protein
VLATVLSIALAASACGNESAAGDSGSKSITWYTSMPPSAAEAVANAYKDKTGIKVNLQAQGTTELWQRVLAERNADKDVADVLSISAWGTLQEAKKQGLLEKIVPGVVPNDPARGEQFVDPEGYSFSTRAVVIALAYNTKAVPDDKVPTDWSDLLDPYWKGKIEVIDPTLDSSGYAAIRQMTLAPDIGWDFFKQLAAQGPVYLTDDSGNLANRLASGESQAMIGQDVQALTLREDGAPIQVVYPPSGVGGSLDFNTLPVHAPNPEGAKEFLKYLASKEAGDVLAKAANAYSARSDAAVFPEDKPSLSDLNLLPKDPEGEAADHDAFGDKFNDVFGRS